MFRMRCCGLMRGRVCVAVYILASSLGLHSWLRDLRGSEVALHRLAWWSPAVVPAHSLFSWYQKLDDCVGHVHICTMRRFLHNISEPIVYAAQDESHPSRVVEQIRIPPFKSPIPGITQGRPSTPFNNRLRTHPTKGSHGSVGNVRSSLLETSVLASIRLSLRRHR